MCSNILLVIILGCLLKYYSYKKGYKDSIDDIHNDAYNDQICKDCKASIDCKRLDYYGYREYCKWED